jgi:hypothetical protein
MKDVALALMYLTVLGLTVWQDSHGDVRRIAGRVRSTIEVGP